MLSANKIYQQLQPNVSFKEWINGLKDIYNSKLDEKSFKTDISFDVWINRKFNLTMNKLKGKNVGADSDASEVISNVTDITNKVLASTSNKSELEKQNNQAKLAQNDNRIFGLNPIVFYSLSAIAAIGIGFGIYKIVKILKSDE